MKTRVPKSIAVLAVLISVVAGRNAFAQENPSPPASRDAFHGQVLFDYFYKVSGDSSGAGTQFSGFRKADQAFQFRRIQLSYDHTFTDRFAAQFLLEGNDRAFDTGGRHGVFVKTAFVQWKNVFATSSLSIGLVPTPTWALFSEKVWNYRSIEKTITDFRGLGAASDMGVLLRGPLGKAGRVNYNLMVGNGNAQKPENNRYKKYYASLNATGAGGLALEAYADYEPAAGSRNRTTVKGTAAYQGKALTVGVEAVEQIQENAGAGGADVKPAGVSVYAWGPIPGTSRVNAFARYDYYDPDTGSDSGLRQNFATLGLDFLPIPDVHVMPNIWVNSFSSKTSGGVTPANRSKSILAAAATTDPATDVVARVTFAWYYR